MKLPHLRHRWTGDSTRTGQALLRCTECGKTKETGLDARGTNAAKAGHAKTSSNVPGHFPGGGAPG